MDTEILVTPLGGTEISKTTFIQGASTAKHGFLLIFTNKQQACHYLQDRQLVYMGSDVVGNIFLQDKTILARQIEFLSRSHMHFWILRTFLTFSISDAMGRGVGQALRFHEIPFLGMWKVHEGLNK